MLSFILEIVCGLLTGSEFLRVFLLFVYIFIALDVSTGSTSRVKTKQLVFRRVEKMCPYALFSALGFWALLWK